jgi:hypothetical protein
VLKRPFDLYKPGWLDQYVIGLANQVAQAMDYGVTQEVWRVVISTAFIILVRVVTLLKQTYLSCVRDMVSKGHPY